jgi:hypothetical protein
MKNSIEKSGQLRCISCGDTTFEYNDDKSWVKCLCCGKEYLNGYNELLELNKPRIAQELKDTEQKDLQKELKNELEKAFRNNKNIKFK